MKKKLVVLLGPTGVGKTELSLHIADRLQSPILSADSRQLYRDMYIGTAAPTPEQMACARHYFVGTLALTDYYSAACFEEQAITLLDELFSTHDYVLLTGGSMLYIDAVCNGIDEMPTVTDEVRRTITDKYEKDGLASLQQELLELDPVFYHQVDLNNHKRVIHAIEICRMTGKPYSQLRTNPRKKRNFDIIKIGLNRPREELFERIARRVDTMIQEGLEEEARRLYPLRQLNSLNTVGYKELFAYFDGIYDLQTAIEKIKRNTRVYAKKQLTWFKRDASIAWFTPDNKALIFDYLDRQLYDI